MNADTWAPIDLVAVGAAPAETPSLGGFGYPGRVHLCSGENESLKTLALQALCADRVRLGETCLWIGHEGTPREALTRFSDLGLAAHEIRDQILYVQPEAPLEPSTQGRLDELLAERRPTVVIVDAYTGSLALHGLDPNAAVDIETHHRTIVEPLRKHGAGVFVIDHVTKNKETRGRFSIGSERKAGVCDVHLGFDRIKPLTRGHSGLVRLHTHKDRPGYLARPYAAELAFHSDPTTHSITWTAEAASEAEGTEGDSWRPTVLMDRVLEHLARHPDPISRSALADAVPGRRQYVFAAIDYLIADGQLSKDGRKVVPVPNTFPGTSGTTDETGTRSRSHSLQGERLSGTPLKLIEGDAA